MASPLPHGRRFAILSVLPFAVFMLLLAVYPLGQVVRLAFSHVRIRQGDFLTNFGTWANFGRLPDDPAALQSAVVTLIFICTTVPLTLLFGTLLAVLIDKTRLFGRFGQSVALWPAVVAPVVVSLIWLLILSPSIGALNRVLEDLGLRGQGWLGSEVGALAIVVLVDVWHWTPVVFLLVYTALKGIDGEILEAARVDGASEGGLFRHIVLPLLLPALAAAGLIRLVMGVKAFDEMFLLTKGGPNGATTLVSLHIRNVFFDRLELGYGAAFSLVVVVFVLAALTAWQAIQRLRAREAA